jgi:hypothetical protein
MKENRKIMCERKNGKTRQLHVLRCDCPRGYRLDTSGQKCVDENECVERPRICGNGTCSNVDGGFDCACADGYAPGKTEWPIWGKFTEHIPQQTKLFKQIYL